MAEERVEQVDDLGRSLVIVGFVGEEKVFELNALWDEELVEVLEDKRDVVAGMEVVEKATEFWMYWNLFRTLDDQHAPSGIILQ